MQHGTGGRERVCLCESLWEEGESVVVVVPYAHHEGYHEYDPGDIVGPRPVLGTFDRFLA